MLVVSSALLCRRIGATGRQKMKHAASASVSIAQQNYDYFLVLDFEATCNYGAPLQPQEIIEFPCLKINAKTLAEEARFHRYVRPDVHPVLFPFCTELTGIVQSMVENKRNLVVTLEEFHEWLVSERLYSDEGRAATSAFVTCGDWDLAKQLPAQCRHIGHQPRGYFDSWINIKQSFRRTHSQWPKGMMDMLDILNITHEGREHSGIDDCVNIANIVRCLITDGAVLQATTVPGRVIDSSRF